MDKAEAVAGFVRGRVPITATRWLPGGDVIVATVRHLRGGGDPSGTVGFALQSGVSGSTEIIVI